MKIESVLDWTRRLRALIALGVFAVALSASGQVSFDELAKELSTARSPVTTDQGTPTEASAEQMLDGSQMPKSSGAKPTSQGVTLTNPSIGPSQRMEIYTPADSNSPPRSGSPFDVWARPMAIGIFGGCGVVLVALRLRRIAPRPR